MSDFLLELLSEEIPARMQEKAQADLARLFEGEIAKAGLKAAAIETHATPRRLALIARDLPPATAPMREETKGPRASAPPQALEGFLRKTGLAREDLVERDGVLFAVVERAGRATADVLAEAIPAVVRGFVWPKSMRWGAASVSTASLRWVRPLQGIVALLGDEVVPFAVDGIASGAATVGHRFHHPGPITIGSAEDYAAKLRACHVVLDAAERRAIIEEGARALAEARGLRVVPDAGLVAENAGLTEWPVPLLGDFDLAFLEVPREVIQLTMRTNQKYFACVSSPERGGGPPPQAVVEGAPPHADRPDENPLHPPAAPGGPPPRAGEDLAPHFICVANVDAADGGAGIVAGNRKVLAARLADARFFWEQDKKVKLEEQARKLDRIVFHEKLGTVADKVERVAKLARWLVEEGIVGGSSPERGGEPSPQAMVEGVPPQAAPPEESPLHPPAAPGGPPPRAGEDRSRLAALAEQAARLSKADLVTGMVGEFPELQGIMGGHYARAEGLPDEVADAIRDHYKPVGQGDQVPTAPVTVAVSLADKLDSVVRFFGVYERPTGSKDPYALRRQALSILHIIVNLSLRVKINDLIAAAWLADGEIQVGTKVHIDLFSKKGRLINRPDFAPFDELLQDIAPFFADRLKVQQREAGIRHDLIDAVFALGGEDDLVRLLARVKALQAFVETEEGGNLLAGYKRAANIIAIEARKDASAVSTLTEENQIGYTLLSEEVALVAALVEAEPRAEAAIAAEDFEAAMRTLAGLRGPVDAFFERVTVNDPDLAKRRARLALLARVRDAVDRVADFSKING